MSESINGRSIADILKRIIYDDLEVSNVSGWAYCGNIAITVGGYEIQFFIDCDELDYVDNATDRDGNVVGYGDFERNPMDFLTGIEKDKLTDIIRGIA